MAQSPTYVEIDLNAIIHNLKEIKKKVAPAKVMAVVKANAYGHGLREVSEVALANGAEYLGVARLEEGIELRKFGMTAPILVFGGFFENKIDEFLTNDLELTVFDEPRARLLSQQAETLQISAKVHIKVDTGMGRVGVQWQEASGFVKALQELKYLEIVGIYTHFASSETKDKTFAKTQLQRFQKVLAELEDLNMSLPLKHAANSGAILDLPEACFDMVRAGVSLYGYTPSLETSESLNLKPSMTLKSQVIAVKDVDKGTPISYGSTYKAHNKTKIATIPIGYGDGYNRLLSNQAQVLVGGKRYPLVGRVCMDQILVDLELESKVQIGDEVVLVGRQGEDEISMWEICEKLETIPYEVTCWVSERVPRIYMRN